MGRINNTAQWDAKKLRKRGKLYSTIDFEVNDNVTEHMFEKMPEKPVIGKLEISNKRFDVTYPELDLMIETLQEAKKVINMRYKMGMMR
jgi:hypothetical protein